MEIGKDIMISPQKIVCEKCGKDYVYATHPNTDDDAEPMYRYL